MMTFILLVVFGADCPPKAPPINPRLAVGYCSLVSCVCTDDGSPCVCAETGEDCECSDCDKVRQPTVKTTAIPTVKAQAPKRLITRVIQDGWTYESRCSRNGCYSIRVPRMVTVQVEE